MQRILHYKNINQLCLQGPLAQLYPAAWARRYVPGNTKGGSITVPLTSCLTGLDQSVLQIKTKIVSCHAADSKPVKQEVNSTMILPPLVFPCRSMAPTQKGQYLQQMDLKPLTSMQDYIFARFMLHKTSQEVYCMHTLKNHLDDDTEET